MLSLSKAWTHEKGLQTSKARKREEKGKQQHNCLVTTSNHGVTLLSNYGGERCHLIEFEVEWIVDSGAYHCSLKREYFTTYKVRSLGSINMRNKSTSQIMGIGNVYMQIEIGCIIILKNVRHVLDLQLNLLFMSTLDKEGYEHFMGKVHGNSPRKL